jgi:hypothetical protein
MNDPFLQPPHGEGFRFGTGHSDGEARVLRDRMTAHEDAIDRAGNSDPFASARMSVQVFDGGAMPSTVPAVYFTHPVLLGGAETEGGSATMTVDTATTVPVIFLGKVPSVGDNVTAYSASGRWVAELGGSSGGGTISCSPCAMPLEDLTISWVNLLSGNGSATLVYNGLVVSPAWTTGCVDGGLQFHLACVDGISELQGIFWVSGVCPTGDSTEYCSNLREEPLLLTLSESTCSPFSLTYTVGEDGCPTLYSFGNSSFTVTL